MTDMRPRPAVEKLRAEIARLESQGRRVHAALPFGIDKVDSRLPGGGLARGALHEIAGGGSAVVHGSAAALFAAGVVARLDGWVLWCLTRPDLFAPATYQAGLDPDRVIYVEAGDDTSVLACCEEGLRHGGLAGVVAEVASLPMTVSRRLQLAAEQTGTMGLALRRWRRPADASDFGQPTAAQTRWRVTALPSEQLPVPGVGRARWLVELIRARAGESADFTLEACDDQGRLALPAELAERSAGPQVERIRASA